MTTDSPARSALLEQLIPIARHAGEIVMAVYATDFAVHAKDDLSPVTAADEQAEASIVPALRALLPGVPVVAEEGVARGQVPPVRRSFWLVDPLDGTKSFVRDTPFFSTQIALMHRGRLVLGVSSACAYGELAWAEEGGGAFLDGKPIRVSQTAGVADAILSTGNLKTLAGAPQWANFGQLVRGVNRLRGYGDFVHYHLLARGALDVVVESDVNILDVAALAVIVREAGGRFTDLSGGELTLGTTTVLASNGRLHDAVGRAVGYGYPG